MTHYLCIFLILVTPALGMAQCRTVYPSTVVHAYPHKEEVVIEKQVFVAQFVPLVVNVPTYAATYAPGYGPQAQVVPAAQVQQPYQVGPQPQGFQTQGFEQRLLTILERLEQRTAVAGTVATTGLPQQPVAQQPVAQQPQQFTTQNQQHTQVFTQKCASCHNQDVAQSKGGGYGFMSGGQLLPNLTCEQASGIADETYQKRMPKGGPELTDEEQGHVMAWFSGVRKSRSTNGQPNGNYQQSNGNGQPTR